MPYTEEQIAEIQEGEQLTDLSVNLGFTPNRVPLSDSLPINMIIEREALQMVSAFEYNQVRFFIPANRIAHENIRYYNGHQYSQADLSAVLGQNRKPYQFNQIEKFVDQFCGEQRTQRTDMTTIPRTDISATFSESMNHYMRWVCQSNKWHDSHSDIFRDGIVAGWGVAGAYLDPRNPFAHPMLERISPFQFMWDVATASNARLENTNFLWRGNFDTMANMMDQFPDQADLIRRNAGTVDQNMYAYYTIDQPVISAPANSLQLDNTFYTWNNLMNPNMVFRREFYHRRYEHRWVVRDGITNTEEDFMPNPDGSCPQEAFDFAEAAYLFYQEPTIVEEFMAPFGIQAPLISEPFRKQCSFIDKYVFAGSALIYRNTYRSDQYPYKFFIPKWYDGELTSYIESMKDPQRFLNRLYMFIDERAGGFKGGVVVNKKYLDPSWQDADIVEYGIQTNPVWLVDKDPQDYPIEQFVHTYGPPQNGPEASELLNRVGAEIDRMGGGANLVGYQESSGQSGRSSEALIAQATLTHIPIYDKDNFFQEDVGKLIISYAPMLDPSVRMFVTDEYKNPVATSFLEHKLGTVFKPEDLDFSIEITEVVASKNEQERRFNKLAMVLQTVLPNDIAATRAAIPMLMKNTGLEASERKEFLENYARENEAMAKAAQEQAQFEREMEQWKMQQGQENIEVKKEALQVQRELGTKFNVTADFTELGPLTKASILNRQGVAAHPSMVWQDDAAKAQMDRVVRNTAQSDFNKLTPQWEKDKGNRADKGVQTPKDRKNRTTPKTK